MAITPRKTIKDPYAKERAAFHANKNTKDVDELKKVLEAHGFGTRPQASADDVEKLKKEILENIELPEVDYALLKEYIVTQIVNKFSKIKTPKDGKDGKSIRGPQGPAGKDGRHAVVDLDALVNKVIARLPKQKEGASMTLAQIKAHLDEAIKKIPPQQQIVRVGGSVASIRALTDVNLDGLAQDAQGNYILSSAGAVDSVNGATGVVVLDADDIDDTSTTHKFATAGEKTKIGHLTVTQAVDLDALETKSNLITVTQAVDLDQMEIDIAALANGMVYKGNWDASAGTFPGAGAAEIGWFYTVSVGGTVDGVVFVAGDRLIGIVNNASTTTFAGNWTQLDATDSVTAVVGLTGSVSKAGLLAALNVEDGADVTDAGNVGSVNAAASTKATPVNADSFPIVDSEASNVIKRITFTVLKSFLKTYNDTLYALTGAVTGSGLTMTTARILGRTTAATGAIEELSTVDTFVTDASTTAKGKVELAIDTEVTTGSDATRAVTPDALAGSTIFGRKTVSIQVYDGATDIATGDGKAYFTIPEALNGMNLVRAQATVVTAGTTNASTIMIHNKTDAQDMLSGAISIASAGTVGTVGTINTTYDDVATNDVIRIDIDSASTTKPKGLMVVLEFQLP